MLFVLLYPARPSYPTEYFPESMAQKNSNNAAEHFKSGIRACVKHKKPSLLNVIKKPIPIYYNSLVIFSIAARCTV